MVVRDRTVAHVRPTGSNGGYNGDAQDTAALAAEVCGVLLKHVRHMNMYIFIYIVIYRLYSIENSVVTVRFGAG